MITKKNSAVCLLIWAWFLVNSALATERELIRDGQFQKSFILLDAAPGKRVPYGILTGLDTNGPVVWDLVQWSSKYPLKQDSLVKTVDGILRYANLGKTVILGSNSEQKGILLGVNGSAEYGKRARKQGEPWVHLLLQQDIENPPAISELKEARFRMQTRLLKSVKTETADYSTGLHAAQFQVFFSVQNLNKQSPGYGKYLWFGIPIYDDRSRLTAAFKAQDTGGTSMYIYTLGSEVFMKESSHDRQWIEH